MTSPEGIIYITEGGATATPPEHTHSITPLKEATLNTDN